MWNMLALSRDVICSWKIRYIDFLLSKNLTRKKNKTNKQTKPQQNKTKDNVICVFWVTLGEKNKQLLLLYFKYNHGMMLSMTELLVFVYCHGIFCKYFVVFCFVCILNFLNSLEIYDKNVRKFDHLEKKVSTKEDIPHILSK